MKGRKTLQECFIEAGSKFPFTVLWRELEKSSDKRRSTDIKLTFISAKDPHLKLGNTDWVPQEKIYSDGIQHNHNSWSWTPHYILINSDGSIPGLKKCSCAFHTVVLRGNCNCGAIYET